jgi:hypothetical protein
MKSLTFHRYIGVDYSGAETADSSLKGIRVYEAGCDSLPMEVEPPPSPRKYWTRRGLSKWLVDRLSEDAPTIVGIDHGFSFPLRYFQVHHLEPDWPAFLDDFQRHWRGCAVCGSNRGGVFAPGPSRRWTRRFGPPLFCWFRAMTVAETIGRSCAAGVECRESNGLRQALGCVQRPPISAMRSAAGIVWRNDQA